MHLIITFSSPSIVQNPDISVEFNMITIPQRYYEASLIYKEVLKLDSLSSEAKEELKRAQTLHLMVGD